MMYALGFSLENRELKAALVSKQGKKTTIELLHSFSLDEEGLDPFKVLEPLIKGKRIRVVTGLSAADIVLRDLHLPMTNPRKIIAVLPFQAEALIPFPDEEALIHPSICKKNRKESWVFLAATKKEKVASHLAALETFHIDPDQVSTVIHALARWASQHYSATPYLKIAYLGRTESFFLLMEKENILTAKLLAYPSNSLERELIKADEFLLSKFPKTRGTPWFFAGDRLQDIPPDAQLPESQLQASPDVSCASQQPFALAIGLCLEALTDKSSIQWRQGNFSPARLRKKQKSQCFFAAASFLIAAALLGPLGHSLCTLYEKNLLQRAYTCLDRIAPEKKAHAEDLEAACHILQKHLAELKKEEKLGTFSPRVAELLAWLSSFNTEEEGLSIALTSLHYLLDPEGKIKVRLALTAPESLAQTFFEKLQQKDSFIDSERGIVWLKEKSSNYNAQFFLK